MIKANDYKPDSPEWVMAKFFDCWRRKAWMRILDYVRPSWLAQNKEPNKLLRLSLHNLVDAEFVQINAKAGIVAVFLVKLRRKIFLSIEESTQTIKLIYEGKRWGVDPTNLNPFEV